MDTIKAFLQKFSKITLPDDTLKRLFIEILERDFGLIVEREKLAFRNGILTVNASPAVKSEIFLRKHKILNKLKESLGSKAPQDIV